MYYISTELSWSTLLVWPRHVRRVAIDSTSGTPTDRSVDRPAHQPWPPAPSIERTGTVRTNTATQSLHTTTAATVEEASAAVASPVACWERPKVRLACHRMIQLGGALLRLAQLLC